LSGEASLGEPTDDEIADIDNVDRVVDCLSTGAASRRSRRADRGGDAGGEGNEELERKAVKLEARKRAAQKHRCCCSSTHECRSLGQNRRHMTWSRWVAGDRMQMVGDDVLSDLDDNAEVDNVEQQTIHQEVRPKPIVMPAVNESEGKRAVRSASDRRRAATAQRSREKRSKKQWRRCCHFAHLPQRREGRHSDLQM
jgi:hypothetical protein